MATSWIEAAKIFGFELHCAMPQGYSLELDQELKDYSNITLSNDPQKAMEGSTVINTDTWFSMGQDVSDEKRKAFEAFQINSNLLRKSDTIIWIKR